MRRVIDLECVLPPDENGVARQYFGAAGHRIGEGDPWSVSCAGTRTSVVDGASVFRWPVIAVCLLVGRH
jgi:hypothetical protein